MPELPGIKPPLSVGGDHSITGGILQAIASPKSKLTGGQKAVLLHFDAHTDTYHQLDHFLGAVSRRLIGQAI